MKRTFPKLALAVAALAIGSAAHAVPIYFDYTGHVTGGTADAPIGAAVSGGFNFETDRLVALPVSQRIIYTFTDWQPTGLTEPLGFMNIDGAGYEVPSLATSYASINFFDGCNPVCGFPPSEYFSFNATTYDAWTPGFTGDLRTISLLLYASYETALPDHPFREPYNGFDGATATPLDVLSLPLPYLSGTYLEQIDSCVDGQCTTTRLVNHNFDVDTVTRGVGPRSVPEPGTLALLGAAAIGVFARRRKQSRQQG
jgi:hypothetical protein